MAAILEARVLLTSTNPAPQAKESSEEGFFSSFAKKVSEIYEAHKAKKAEQNRQRELIEAGKTTPKLGLKDSIERNTGYGSTGYTYGRETIAE